MSSSDTSFDSGSETEATETEVEYNLEIEAGRDVQDVRQRRHCLSFAVF